jgi:hypothetical protein
MCLLSSISIIFSCVWLTESCSHLSFLPWSNHVLVYMSSLSQSWPHVSTTSQSCSHVSTPRLHNHVNCVFPLHFYHYLSQSYSHASLPLSIPIIVRSCLPLSIPIMFLYVYPPHSMFTCAYQSPSPSCSHMPTHVHVDCVLICLPILFPITFSYVHQSSSPSRSHMSTNPLPHHVLICLPILFPITFSYVYPVSIAIMSFICLLLPTTLHLHLFFICSRGFVLFIPIRFSCFCPLYPNHVLMCLSSIFQSCSHLSVLLIPISSHASVLSIPIMFSCVCPLYSSHVLMCLSSLSQSWSHVSVLFIPIMFACVCLLYPNHFLMYLSSLSQSCSHASIPCLYSLPHQPLTLPPPPLK